MHRTQEKYLRMHACENILLEIPCFKSVNSQKKLLQYCITIRGKQRNQLSHAKVCCRENQEISQWLLSWTFGGWLNHQMKSKLLIYKNFNEERTYCAISRICKLFMYKHCNLQFFFWSNIEISFTFLHWNFSGPESLFFSSKV